MDWKNLIRPGLALLLVVIGCAVVARFLSSGETLAEYAEKNPEVAYGSTAATEAYTEITADTDAGEDTADNAGTAEGSDTTGKDSAGKDNSNGTNSTAEERSSAKNSVAGSASDAGSTKASSASKSGAAKGSSGNTKESTSKKSSAGTSGASNAGENASNDAGSQNTASRTDDEASPEGAALSSFVDDSDVAADRVILEEGFFYEPIPAAVYRRMLNVSYPEDCSVSLEDLRYVNIRYVDFYDTEQDGEIVCNRSIAEDLTEIFMDLYHERYQLESVRLVDDFGGDDDASMLANNTSCFNYRTVAGSSKLSNHALGLAIDINPLYNPWVNHGEVIPAESAAYADRSADFPHKIDEDDYCCQCFVNHGFFWGGNWNNPDFQHFQRN